MLDHPEYRERYAANLRRIPFASEATLEDGHWEPSEEGRVLPRTEKMPIPRFARDDKRDLVAFASAIGGGGADESIGPSARKSAGLRMTMPGVGNSKVGAVVVSHPCAKSAQGWGTWRCYQA
jgi:hypothetical protein